MSFDTVKIRVYHSLMKQNAKQNVKASKYHHGDLRQALIDTAATQIKQEGVSSLSMRKLGELVGVSRTALYHHFSNKSDLLSAVAESGFNEWQKQTEQVLAQQHESAKSLLTHYILGYFTYAIENSAKYELMFGKEIWAQEQNSDSLNDIAYQTFNYHVNLIKSWQEQGLINAQVPSLRVAQVTWGSLHGISKLFIDGVYIDTKNLEELAETVVTLLLTSS